MFLLQLTPVSPTILFLRSVACVLECDAIDTSLHRAPSHAPEVKNFLVRVCLTKVLRKHRDLADTTGKSKPENCSSKRRRRRLTITIKVNFFFQKREGWACFTTCDCESARMCIYVCDYMYARTYVCMCEVVSMYVHKYVCTDLYRMCVHVY